MISLQNKFNRNIFTESIIDDDKTGEVISNNNNLDMSPVKLKRMKTLEKILTQKIINLNDLRAFAWKGIPFGIH